MFPGEMVILMAMTINKDAGRELLTRPMDVSNEYIVNLYNSLVHRGFLKKNGAMNYKLTPSGRETLEEFLQSNTYRARDSIKRLRQLGIEISKKLEQKVDRVERQTVKA